MNVQKTVFTSFQNIISNSTNNYVNGNYSIETVQGDYTLTIIVWFRFVNN
jgi:hypothetical protein